MSDTAQSQVRSASLTGGSWWAVFVFALVLTIGLGVFVAFMVFVADDAETDERIWNRYALLYGSIQAIVAAAIGWVFGREVYRHSAASAQQSAEQANEQAVVARQQATAAEAEVRALAAQSASDRTRGQALYAAIMASAIGADGPDFRPLNGSEGDETATSRASQLRSLRALAEQLYGDQVARPEPDRAQEAPTPDPVP